MQAVLEARAALNGFLGHVQVPTGRDFAEDEGLVTPADAQFNGPVERGNAFDAEGFEPSSGRSLASFFIHSRTVQLLTSGAPRDGAAIVSRPKNL
ncbi:Hypothetical protein NTJ_06994 [Nesidiocoris tenuis]|uniref:Uncharacterized protein n=1 Tax=Nesidiocoris tenuis TaxID=355587 RepID=A0ABN7ATC8_9HEMI|nr:Hypothetical protein NTJ_06994 [Nesidiocoris tenuis]